MSSADAAFVGPIPTIYDRLMVPMLFVPYAADLARRAAQLDPRYILEIAAGTGAVTKELRKVAPQAQIIATDLNRSMLRVAARRVQSPRLIFQQADAQSLPFADGSFDLILCQFGAMFFPDRVKAYREARRVLRPGGHFLFNVWGSIEDNPVAAEISKALAGLFPEEPPTFFARVPHGYHDEDIIRADLDAAGFEHVTLEAVQRRCHAASARDAAIALCQGSPLRDELEALGSTALARGTEAATNALTRFEGRHGLDAPMLAHIVTARIEER